MFIKKTAAFEIEQEMQKHLVSNALENSYGFEKIAKAVDYLNAAAEIFDDVGMSKQAEALTVLLESLAKKKNKSKKPTKKLNKKELTSEKMVKNLKEKGWVFNSDNNDNNYVEDFEKDENEMDMARMMHLLEEKEKSDFEDELPSDYEPCAECGFDHEYEWAEAHKYHKNAQ